MSVARELTVFARTPRPAVDLSERHLFVYVETVDYSREAKGSVYAEVFLCGSDASADQVRCPVFPRSVSVCVLTRGPERCAARAVQYRHAGPRLGPDPQRVHGCCVQQQSARVRRALCCGGRGS
jgi:hypothetical protein